MQLSTQDVERFRQRGYCVQPGFYDQASIKRISDWLDALRTTPPPEGAEACYYEQSPVTGEELLVRVEHILGAHNPEITRNQLIALRKLEQRAAAELCGVKHVLFMGEEDGFLRSTRELRERVTREIRRIRPELIIITDPDRYFSGDNYINHPDHRNAGLVALDAIFPAADNPMFYPEMMDEGYLPHKISQLYVHGHIAPNVRIDITDLVQTKIDAILCHKSQFSEPPEAVRRWMERWGEEQEDGSLKYYEYFKAMKFT